MTSAAGPHLAMGTYPDPGRHRPRPVAHPVGGTSLAAFGVLSDYLIRTASILGILAVLGVASAVGEHQAPTAGAAANSPAQHSTTR